MVEKLSHDVSELGLNVPPLPPLYNSPPHRTPLLRPPPQEVEKLSHDVSELGLNVAVFGEWYNVETMVSMRFFDDNTRSWWTPATGGCGVEGGRGCAGGDKGGKGGVCLSENNGGNDMCSRWVQGGTRGRGRGGALR